MEKFTEYYDVGKGYELSGDALMLHTSCLLVSVRAHAEVERFQ